MNKEILKQVIDLVPSGSEATLTDGFISLIFPSGVGENEKEIINNKIRAIPMISEYMKQKSEKDKSKFVYRYKIRKKPISGTSLLST